VRLRCQSNAMTLPQFGPRSCTPCSVVPAWSLAEVASTSFKFFGASFHFSTFIDNGVSVLDWILHNYLVSARNHANRAFPSHIGESYFAILGMSHH